MEINGMTNFIVDMFSLIILFVVFCCGGKRFNGKKTVDHRLFFLMLILNSLALILDGVSWLTNGKDSLGAIWASRISTWFLYPVGTAVPFLWCVYVDYKIFKNLERLKKSVWFYVIPFILEVILVCANSYIPILYRFTSENVYERVYPFSYLHYAILIGYAIISLVLIHRNRKKLPRYQLVSMMCYILIPYFGLIVQWIFYGISLMYPCIALALLVVYIMVQSDSSMALIVKSLSEIYYCTYYINVKDEVFLKIKCTSSYEDYASYEADLQGFFETWIEDFVDEEYAESMKHFFDLDIVKSRMKDLDIISMEFLDKDRNWERVSFIASDRDKERNLTRVIFVAQLIDEEKKREIKHLREIEKVNEEKVEIEKQISLVNEIAYIDSLTKTYNRRYFDEQKDSISKFHALAMIDIDHFKNINDTFGHDAGDIAIKTVAEIMTSNVRNIDAVVRYGGDEFVIAFYEINEVTFINRLEAIRKEVSNITIENYPNLKLTISVGGIYYKDNPNDNVMKLADELLYKAKETRNCVKVKRI